MAEHRGTDNARSEERTPSDLRPLSSLNEWELTPGQPDPRGRTIRDVTGERIGDAKDLIASPTTARVHFVVAETATWPRSHEVLLPIESVNIRGDEVISQVTRSELLEAPEWDRDPASIEIHTAFWHGAGTQDARQAGPDVLDVFGDEEQVLVLGVLTLRRRDLEQVLEEDPPSGGERAPLDRDRPIPASHEAVVLATPEEQLDRAVEGPPREEGTPDEALPPHEEPWRTDIDPADPYGRRRR